MNGTTVSLLKGHTFLCLDISDDTYNTAILSTKYT
jgi:hypothetical protein